MALNNRMAPLCVKGCGFYGSQENKNMCSKCYKDYLKAELIAKSAKALENLTSNPPATSNVDDISDSTSTKATTTGDSVSISKRINRCKKCNKKVGLTGFKCRCGQLFCGVHRYPKEHSCTFDFKKADREILVKQNPFINADKLTERI